MSVATPIRRPDTVPVEIWPQVNLLPAEVTRGRRLRGLKKLLGLALALVVLIGTLGYAGALLLANNAADELAAEQAENADLLAQKAEYAEVPATLSAIALAEMARQQAMAPEIVWPDYLEALRAVTPEGVSYDSMSVAVASPGQAYSGSTNPLAGTTIGQVTFSARSTTLPDTAAWIESIEGVSGLANPWFSSASLTEEEGVVFYQVSASVDLLPSALAGRFEPEVAP